MASKVDALIESIGGLREDIGGFRADIGNLKHDRDQQERNTREIEGALGKLRDGTQASIGELRDSMKQGFAQVAQKLAEHDAKVSRMQRAPQLSRLKLATLASIGLIALSGLALIVDAAIRWAVDRVLSMKFGG